MEAVTIWILWEILGTVKGCGDQLTLLLEDLHQITMLMDNQNLPLDFLIQEH